MRKCDDVSCFPTRKIEGEKFHWLPDLMVKEDKSYSASFDDIIWTGTTEYDRPGSKVESLAAIAEGLKVCFMCGAK